MQRLHSATTNTQDPAKRLALTFQFYRLINRIGTSPRLLLTLQFLAFALPNDFYFSTSRWPATETVYRERTLAALESRDPDRAAAAAEEHLLTCAKVTVDELRERGYWSQQEAVADAAS